MSRLLKGLFLLSILAFSSLSVAEEVSKEQIKGLDEQVQDIKKDVLSISSELNLLEEKLLYPSNTQVSFFVSFSGDKDFRLDSVEIELDGKVVAHHIYSFKELEALREGGMQRIYTGNVRTGGHQIKVGFIGKSSVGNEYKKVEAHQFSKGVGPGIVEIALQAPTGGAKSIQFKDL